MSITSVSFWLLFILFYILYCILWSKFKVQNIYLLTTSYLFYALIDWRFCCILLFSSIMAYYSAIYIGEFNVSFRKKILISYILLNVGILFVFKYYDFFAGECASLFGIDKDALLLKLLLPVGISFYTFTSIGYVIDVYNGKVKATKDIVSLLAFISFFSLLMSGPIERSTGLLPQFKKRRMFDYCLAVEGVQQIIWGIFKKLVVADNCALVVKNAFANYENLPASCLVTGGILYSIQIYFDFSGYSDMAIGMSKMLGFRVRRNFHYPYFALNVSDFWRRWHMSLQSWLTDYIYIPLGGSRCSKYRTLFNTFVVFIVCGIWHGANWTFIVWGLYHAALFIPLILFLPKSFRKSTVDTEDGRISFYDIGLMITTFIFVTIGWIIFNSPSLSVAIHYISGIFNPTLLILPTGIGLADIRYVLFLMVFVLLFEWIQRDKETPLFFNASGWVKALILYLLLAHIVFCDASQSDFIYYQF